MRHNMSLGPGVRAATLARRHPGHLPGSCVFRNPLS